MVGLFRCNSIQSEWPEQRYLESYLEVTITLCCTTNDYSMMEYSIDDDQKLNAIQGSIFKQMALQYHIWQMRTQLCEFSRLHVLDLLDMP